MDKRKPTKKELCSKRTYKDLKLQLSNFREGVKTWFEAYLQGFETARGPGETSSTMTSSKRTYKDLKRHERAIQGRMSLWFEAYLQGFETPRMRLHLLLVSSVRSVPTRI